MLEIPKLNNIFVCVFPDRIFLGHRLRDLDGRFASARRVESVALG